MSASTDDAHPQGHQYPPPLRPSFAATKDIIVDPSSDPSLLLELDAIKLSNLIQTGKLSCYTLMKATLSKIEKMNPTLNAIIELANQDQLYQQAQQKDKELHLAKKNGDTSHIGWLHGIPLAIKDMSNTKGFPTTLGGCPFFNDTSVLSKIDDPFVYRLKRNGAIIIGKTNSPEYGLGSHTYNTLYGRTKNAQDPTKSAGGSSGGAAVVISSRMLCLSDGSDMMGSLRNPAGWNSIYSIRPTSVLLSDVTMPSVPFLGYPISTVGPMARCPNDLIMMLQTFVGNDQLFHGRKELLGSCHDTLNLSIIQDNNQSDLGGLTDESSCTTSSSTKHKLPNKQDEAEATSSKIINIGWLGDWNRHYPMENGILSTCEHSLQQLSRNTSDSPSPNFQNKKIIIHDLTKQSLFSAPDLWRSWTTIRSEVISYTLLQQFDESIILGEQSPFKPEVQYEVKQGIQQSRHILNEAIAISKAWKKRAKVLFKEYDVLALPSAQLFPFPIEMDWPKEIDGHKMDSYHRWMECVVPVSLLGLPCVTVPAITYDTSPKLPIGIQLFGDIGDDVDLLQLAQIYHDTVYHR